MSANRATCASPGVEAALLAADAQLGPAFEHAPVIMLATTAGGVIRRANQAARAATRRLGWRSGATLAGLLGCSHTKAEAGASRDTRSICGGCVARRLVSKTSEERRPSGPIEVSMLASDGTRGVFRVSAAPLDPDGTLVLVSLQDATRERAAERAAHISEARYASLVSCTQDAVGLLDEDLRWIALNPAMRALVRRTPEHSEGLDLSRLSPPLRGGGRGSAEILRERVSATQAGSPQRFELECVGADGETLVLDVAAVKIDGGLVQVVVREITDIREAQECIEAERDLLLALSRADDLESAVRIGVDGIVRITGMAEACICLRDPSTGELRPTHSTGVACQGGLLFCQETAASHAADADASPKTRVPFSLRHDGRLLGWITVTSDTRRGIPRYRLLAAETATSALAAVIARCRAAQVVSATAAGLRAVIESTDCTILMLDRDLRLQLFNAAWAEHVKTGYGIEARVGLELLSRLPSRRSSWWRDLYHRALRGERIRETFVDSIGGQQRVYGVVIHPIVEGGRVIGVSQFARDLTSIRQTHERLAELSRSIVLGHEEERRRLSRELHDEIGQVLTAVKISLQRLQNSGVAEPVGQRLAAATRNVHQAISDVRRLCTDLRPPLLSEAGLVPALEALAERLGRDDERAIVFDTGRLVRRPPIEVESAVFRVVQEALTNALRHSGARTIRIAVRPDDGRLFVAVRDDGQGFDPLHQDDAVSEGGLGIVGMRERVEALSGNFELVSHPGEGTEVRAWLPVPADAGPGS